MSACEPPPADAAGLSHDPVGLIEFLEASDRFHRDNGLGGILHPGTISYRESVTHHSVHILIRGNRVSAHVDRYSPLTITRTGTTRYSLPRALAHNLAHLGEEFVRVLSGRRGEHRCVMDCQRIEVNDETVDAVLAGACDVGGDDR